MKRYLFIITFILLFPIWAFASESDFLNNGKQSPQDMKIDNNYQTSLEAAASETSPPISNENAAATNSKINEEYIFPNASYAYTIYPNNQHSATLRRSQGRAIYADGPYTTLEGLSFPVHIGNTWPFLNLRLHQFDVADEYAMNAGLGMRFGSYESTGIFGINAYYDFNRNNHASFNQMGIGFEILGKFFSFRINGYIPVGTQSRLMSSCFYDNYVGGYFFLQENYQESCRGANMELEGRIGFKWGEVHLGAGPYYINRKRGCITNAVGGSYRLSSDIGDYFTFNVNGSYDNIFKGRVQVQVGLIVPFNFQSDNGSFLGNSNHRLFRPVQRNDAMMLKNRTRYITNF